VPTHSMYTFMHIFAHADAWAHTSHIGMGASIRSSTEYAHTRTYTVIHPSTRKHAQARASTRKHTFMRTRAAHAHAPTGIPAPTPSRRPGLQYARARATCALVVAYAAPIGAHICACARMCIRHSCTYVHIEICARLWAGRTQATVLMMHIHCYVRFCRASSRDRSRHRSHTQVWHLRKHAAHTCCAPNRALSQLPSRLPSCSPNHMSSCL
jgi:hypothetical protein